RGILGDKRGLGKTLTSIAYADMVEARKVLVIGINDVLPQILEELQRFAPDRKVYPFDSMSPSQRALVYPVMRGLDEFVITLNYEAWRKDKTIIDELVRLGIDTVIIDEAHKTKSSGKITARGIFQI